MNKKMKYIFALIVIVLFALLTVLTMKVRNGTSTQDGLILSSENKTVTIRLDDLGRALFSGEIINGKGEISNHEYKGVELNDLLEENDFDIDENTQITVTSEDNYSITLESDMVTKKGVVYIAIECDGKMIENIEGSQGCQLVVYGDSDSKRQVRYLKTVIIE